MNAQVLINLDDLSKLMIVEHFCSSVRRINFKKCEELVDRLKVYDLKNVYTNFALHGNTDDTLKILNSIMAELDLYSHFSIPSKIWQTSFFKLYLKFFHPDSSTKLEYCDRYSLENYKGVKVVAKKDVISKTIMKNLFGYYKPISREEEISLVAENNDFSVINSTRSKKQNIFLGSVAFVNHDCMPNCEYITGETHMVYLRTITNINKGEEVLVCYGESYFGNENKYCECQTCKSKDSIMNSNNSLEVLTKNHNIHTSEFMYQKIRPESSSQDLDTSNSPEDFFGFAIYQKLDEKIDKAYVKLEIMDPLIVKLYQTKSKSEKKLAFCIYCNEFRTQLPRHLRLCHADQDIVEMFMNKDEDDVTLKNKAINFIRSQGFGHYKELTGIVIPNKNKRKDATYSVEKDQCGNCFGYFSRKTMWKHRQSCASFSLLKIRSLS